MLTYLYRGRYTAAGVAGVVAEGGSPREQATRAAFEAAGGRIIHYGFVLGDDDFIILAEMPDDAAAVVPGMLARASGTVEVTAIRVYSPEEIDAAATRARVITFRAAGTH